MSAEDKLALDFIRFRLSFPVSKYPCTVRTGQSCSHSDIKGALRDVQFRYRICAPPSQRRKELESGLRADAA